MARGLESKVVARAWLNSHFIAMWSLGIVARGPQASFRMPLQPIRRGDTSFLNDPRRVHISSPRFYSSRAVIGITWRPRVLRILYGSVRLSKTPIMIGNRTVRSQFSLAKNEVSMTMAKNCLPDHETYRIRYNDTAGSPIHHANTYHERT